MEVETGLYGAADGAARVSRNRPERLNAINAQLIADLREAVATANADAAVRGVVLSGEGRGLCAGCDLGGRGRVGGAPTRVLWVSRLPLEHAKRLMLSGEALSGVEAARLGLASRAVPAHAPAGAPRRVGGGGGG